MDWGAIGTSAAAIISAGGLAAGGFYAWWLKQQRDHANTRADVSESNAQTAVADSQKTVYSTLADRVNAQEARIQNLETGLDRERELRRMAEDKVHALQMDNVILRAELRRHGITLPPSTLPEVLPTVPA